MDKKHCAECGVRLGFMQIPHPKQGHKLFCSRACIKEYEQRDRAALERRDDWRVIRGGKTESSKK